MAGLLTTTPGAVETSKEEGKEVAQLVAELETTFKLPVISPSLKNRYENVSFGMKFIGPKSHLS